MIQRIQTVWLFLASMLAGALLMPSMTIYSYTVGIGIASRIEKVTATNYYPLMVLAALTAILAMVAIFMFGNRKRQKGFVTLSMLSCIAFLLVMFMKVSTLSNEVTNMSSPQYGILAAIIPVLVLIFLIMAYRGIRKDEKLIKSLDRLR